MAEVETGADAAPDTLGEDPLELSVEDEARSAFVLEKKTTIQFVFMRFHQTSATVNETTF